MPNFERDKAYHFDPQSATAPPRQRATVRMSGPLPGARPRMLVDLPLDEHARRTMKLSSTSTVLIMRNEVLLTERY